MNHVYYQNIISVKNLCEAWQEFLPGKRYKKDVAEFSLNLSDNILKLNEELRQGTYRHGSYKAFAINDPKPRSIHKASVRDRLLHHAIYRVLYHYFEKKFIFDSYSCRDEKGTHRPLDRLKRFYWQASKSNKVTCWVLKCDVKKFFANIDHEILFKILKRHITETDTIKLLEIIIKSFSSTGPDKGLPLGNLTSQLLVNIYMNEFDQFVKHKLRVRHYIRYADDFIILSDNRIYLEELLGILSRFLEEDLKLTLHPDKVFIKTISSGMDFLGWVHFPHNRVLRTVTKRRMLRRLGTNPSVESKASYLGMLKWGNTYMLKRKLSLSREIGQNALS